MGDRANYAIVTENGWELYYSHHGALTIDRDFLDGPDAAQAFVRDHDKARTWMDDGLCEGAVLIDVPNEVLRLFTWHHDGVNDRRRWLRDIHEAWPGWDVGWAYSGVEDLVAYVGLDRKSVRLDRGEPQQKLNVPLDGYPQDADCVITIRENDAVRGYAVCQLFCELPRVGPRLIEMTNELTPSSRKRESAEDSGPDSGIHIDVDKKEIGVWTVTQLLCSVQEIAERWPGWRFEFWEDRHEEQTRRCGDFPMFPW